MSGRINQKDGLPEISNVLIQRTAEEIVRDKYGSSIEDAKKWGFVENTWQDKQFQEAEWKAFVEKAMKGILGKVSMAKTVFKSWLSADH